MPARGGQSNLQGRPCCSPQITFLPISPIAPRYTHTHTHTHTHSDMDVCLLVEDRLVFKDDPRAAAARARDRKGDKERRKRQVP